MSGNVARFLASQVAQILSVMFFASIIVFIIMTYVPGSPAEIYLGPEATQQQVEAMEREMGLHEPIYVQYLNWIQQLFTEGLGTSMVQGAPVADLIWQALPVTLQISFFAMVFVILIGIPVGVVSAVDQYTAKDYVATVLALLAFSSPQFFTAILLILVFSIWIPIFPALGFVNVADHFFTGAYYTILPGFALGAAYWGVVIRMQRSAMLDVLSQEYVDAARARGLKERTVIYSHALRNAMIPVITIMGIQIGWLMNGSILIEIVFNLPGVGDLLVTAIFQRDYAVVQGLMLLIAFAFVFANLVVDVVYAFIDPRIQY